MNIRNRNICNIRYTEETIPTRRRVEIPFSYGIIAPQGLTSSLNNLGQLDRFITSLFQPQSVPRFDNIITLLLNNSLYDSEVKRNDDIILNAETQRYSTLDSALQNQNTFCSVCQENFETESSVCILDCNHVFHDNCMREWVKYNQKCPNCRHPIECDEE